MLYPRDDPGSTPLTCGWRIGLTFVFQSACLSCAAVLALLAYVGYNAFRHCGARRWHFINFHLDLYLLGLLLSDLIQSIGAMMDIIWVIKAGVIEGHFCTIQGVLKQFGEVGVALCSITIAIHTFATIVLRWKEPKGFTLPLVVLGFIVVFLMLVVGLGYAAHRDSDYFGNTKYWCWIRADFEGEIIGLEYFWLWAAAFINLILYLPVFFTLQRLITVEGRGLRCRMRRTTPRERQMAPDIDPRRMLYYPAVYIVTVLPIGIARIRQLVVKSAVPPPATFFGAAVFSASGLFNVVVYTITRPGLLRPAGALTRGRQDRRSDRIKRIVSAHFRADGPRSATSASELDSMPPTPHNISRVVYQDSAAKDESSPPSSV